MIANTKYGDVFEAFSAGSAPAGHVHPRTLHYLQARDLAIDGLQSQSWDDFEDEGLDLVITVCDSAANETCPLWMGDTPRLHWGMPDPSRIDGTEQEEERAFYDVMDALADKLSELSASMR